MTDLTTKPDHPGSPLPLAVGLDMHGRVIVSAADGWVVCVVGPPGGPGDHEGRVLADAHRIAAGAQALRAFDRLADDLRQAAPPGPDLFEAARRAHVALADYQASLARQNCRSFIPGLAGLVGDLSAALLAVEGGAPCR